MRVGSPTPTPARRPSRTGRSGRQAGSPPGLQPGRRLDIEGTYNFRDVGGYPAGPGWTRGGVLFRSDSLAGVSPSGAADLAALRIGVVVDLRSDLERAGDRRGSALPGALHVRLPIHGGSRASFVDGEVTLASLYGQILDDSAWSLAAVVAVVADSGASPVLVHCTAGKDRTGLAIALTLEAAGVDREAVIADYAQSALNLDGPWVDRALTTLISRGVPISPRLFEVLGGSPDHAMGEVLEVLDRRYGSVLGYLRAHGLAEDSAEALRAKLVMT
jgi:protein-tyrosine phosphatase